LWYFFEQELHYPITSINTTSFEDIDLYKYTVLILPDGNYKGLFDESNLEKLQDWVKKGGKVIAIDGALKSFADKKGFNLKTNTIAKDSSETNLIPYAEREREDTNQLITGAIFKTTVDNTHPMAFGYGTDYFTLKQGSDSYSLLEDDYNVVYLGEHPKNIAGFAGKEAIKKLDNSLVFGEERLGKGSMIYMVDNTLFRNFWQNGKLFFVNAIFFVNNNAFDY
jgi:hypothetical protein